MMNRRSIALLATLLGLPALPVFAQTTIGGGTCTSATLSGTYELLLSGRQLTSSGLVTQIFQGVGTASFDGLNKITIALTTNTVTSAQNFGTQVTWTGTYSLQANCVGTVNITGGNTATFTLEAYNQTPSETVSTGFALVGSDASYAFNGTGTVQPATCPTTITGTHEFNGTGAGLSGATVASTLNAAGILQFDGQGNLTANWTEVSNLTTTQVNATGAYTVGAGCLASAVVTDTANNKYTIAMSLSSAAGNAGLAVSSSTLVFDGTASAAQAAAVTACSTASMNGTYYLTLGGRVTSGGAATKIFLGNGAATFDGAGNVTFNLTANTVNGANASWENG